MTRRDIIGEPPKEEMSRITALEAAMTYLWVHSLVVNLGAERILSNSSHVELNDGIRKAILVQTLHIAR